MFESLKQIPDEVLNELLDKKEGLYYGTSDGKIERIGE